MKVDNTSKITTIIGLVFEGFGVVIAALVGTGMAMINAMSKSEVTEFFGSELTQSEIDLFLLIASVLGIIVIVLGVISFIFFLVNLVLFTKLLNGKFDEETASKVFLYQAIYGGVNLLFNQLVGVLYLVSGIQGRQKITNKNKVPREGL